MEGKFAGSRYLGYRAVTGSSPCKFVQRGSEDRSMMPSLPCLPGGMGSGKLLFNPLISNTFVPDYSRQENTTKKKMIYFYFGLVWFILFFFYILCVFAWKFKKHKLAWKRLKHRRRENQNQITLMNQEEHFCLRLLELVRNLSHQEINWCPQIMYEQSK